MGDDVIEIGGLKHENARLAAEVARLRASPLAWTATPPASPGWYWWKDAAGVAVMEVRASDLGLVCDHHPDGDRYAPPVAGVGGLWAGPLPEPREGTPDDR